VTSNCLINLSRRLVIKLDRAVHRKGQLSAEMLNSIKEKRKAALASTFIIAEPLTLYVPLLCNCVEGENIEVVLRERIRYVAESIRPLWEYGKILSGFVALMTLQEPPTLFTEKFGDLVPESVTFVSLV